jgi:large subunit ribosomal protein L10
MVSERKKTAVEQLSRELKEYSVIGMLDMFKLPAKQLQEIRDSLKGKALIKMAKKNVIKLAIENAGMENLQKLEGVIKNQPALLLSNVNPFELAGVIEASRSSASAKAGDIATKEIMIKAGPTSLKPGPVIGELQRVKLPAGVEGDKIVIKNDTVIVKEGGEITKPVAEVLMKLGIEPIEISLNMLAAYDNGTIYGSDLLFIPKERYENDLITAYKNALGLALGMDFPVPEALPLMIAKAYREAMAIAYNTGTREDVHSRGEKPQTRDDTNADKKHEEEIQ